MRSAGAAFVSRTSSGVGRAAMCRGEPAPIQTKSWASRVRSMKTRSPRGTGKGATAPGSKPVSSRTSPGRATRAPAARAARAILAVSARLSPGMSARTGRPSQRQTRDLTISLGSQPTARAASAAVAVPESNSSIRASAPSSRRNTATRSTASGHAIACASVTVNVTQPLSSRTFDEPRRETNVTDKDDQRSARTESLFRDVNERIAETADRFDAPEAQFVCECDDPKCTHGIEATLETYEEVREDGATFLVADEHVNEDIERVVDREPGFTIVEKLKPRVRKIVRALDPRAETA